VEGREEFLFARAIEHDSPKLLFRQACEYLSSSRLVRPGVVSILDRNRIATARERAREETWARIEPLLGGTRRGELDRLLKVDPVLGRTRLAWLGAGTVAATPAAVKGELEKLAWLRRMDADTVDLSVLPAERRRFLAGVGRRLTAQNLARREPARRYPILLTLVAESAVDVLDEVLLFDQALSGRESAARARLTQVLAERARGGEDRQALLHAARIRSWPTSPRSRAPIWSSPTSGSSTIFRMSSSSGSRTPSPPRSRNTGRCAGPSTPPATSPTRPTGGGSAAS
jgi:hypothetical protein